MKRAGTAFLAILAVTFLVAPLVGEAQPAGTRPRIGFLGTSPTDRTATSRR
jgi:hypothetical protein